MKRDILNRREFVARAAAAAGGAALASIPAWGASPEPRSKKPWKMRLSTSSIHYMQLPIEEACEQIAALGFEAIDIWSAHEGCPHLDDVAKRLGPGGLKDVLKTHGLKLYTFSTYRGGYEKYAKLLGEAGGGVAVQGSTGPCKPDELTAKMKAFLESRKPLVELAEKYDSYLAIENHGNALLDSLDSFKAFVDLNRSPRLGIALAPYHIQGRKASVEETIEIAGRQLFFFYAWQRRPGLEQLPGHGPADFTPWIQALAKIDYSWYVNPFMHGHPETKVMSAALAKARDYLKDCSAKAAGNAGSD